MWIEPRSKTLVSDITAIINNSRFVSNIDYHQLRLGRYVANIWHCGLIAECLLLNDDNDVIDGFVRGTVEHLPWKDKSFCEWLGHSPEYEFSIEDAQDDYEKHYWSI